MIQFKLKFTFIEIQKVKESVYKEESRMDGLRQIMADLLTPEKAAAATAQMKELKNNQLLLPSLMQIALSDPEPQIRQMAAVILRKETSKRFNSLGQADQAQLKEAVIKGLFWMILIEL